MKKIKTIHLFGTDYKNIRQRLKERKKTFTIEKTGYSFTIKTDTVKYYGSTGRNSKQLFGIYQKIISDVKKCNVVIDAVPRNNISYFDISNRISNNRQLKAAYCVDINSAYATLLRNNGIISEETFISLQNTKKENRLKAVGMLATAKLTFEYVNGELTRMPFMNKSPYSNYFFYACYEIGLILKECEKIAGDEFLFFWVDGIYIKSLSVAEKIEDFIMKSGFNCKIETLHNFRIKHKKNNLIKLEYIKNGKRKPFIIPKKEIIFDPEINKPKK